MGKKLIVKGADFSLNCLSIDWNEESVYQGYINTNSGSSSYGKVYTTGTSANYCIMAKVFIPAGKTMEIKVTNNDVPITDLLTSYNASANNISFADQALLTDISDNLHPANSEIRQADGTFLVENATANGLYYYLNFAYNIASGPAISITGKKLLYKQYRPEPTE